MNPMVPATKPIKYKNVRHIETDRLLRRHHHLGDMLFFRPKEVDSRSELRQRARELICIEDELDARNALDIRYSRV